MGIVVNKNINNSSPGNRYFIQVYHLLQYNIHNNLPVSMKNSIILLLCIFESSVRKTAIMGWSAVCDCGIS